MQELPAERDQDQAARNADDRERDAEEHQQMRTDEHRPRKKPHAVDSNATRQRVTFSFRAGGRKAEEDRRVPDRVDDRK